MPLFNQSTKAVSAVVTEIADSAGAQNDPDMQARAGRSLNATLEHLNTRFDWNFLLSEPAQTGIFGTFTVGGVSASANNTSAACPANHGILVDDLVSFAGLPLGTRVSATAAGGFGFGPIIDPGIGAGTEIVTATINRDFYNLPADFRKSYSVRLYGTMNALRPFNRREYDRSIVSEFTPSTPVGYDLFGVYGKGKIRLLPLPAQNDVMELRYFRRITIPTATGATEALDVIQDFEPYAIAWAKWHFLMDKGEGRSEQASTWLTFAEGGFKTMMGDQTRVPDEDLMLKPGAWSYDPAQGPNSTRYLFDNFGL